MSRFHEAARPPPVAGQKMPEGHVKQAETGDLSAAIVPAVGVVLGAGAMVFTVRGIPVRVQLCDNAGTVKPILYSEPCWFEEFCAKWCERG